MDKKSVRLNRNLKGLGSAVVAFSGGLDSTFLLRSAIDAMGAENVLAVTAVSRTYPDHELAQAKRIAKMMGARLMTIKTDELSDPRFRSNPVNRCYYCKKELFGRLDRIRKEKGMKHVVDGTNRDDQKDIRHGRKAASELKVRSPLSESGLGKADIRRLSKDLGLPTWDKPSFACLASRIPFGNSIKARDLSNIDKAEGFLRDKGFRQFRVRVHDNIARIELVGDDIKRAAGMRKLITGYFKKLGFVYITLDLAGYRTGSMHEA